MLEKAISKILSLAENKIHEVHGEYYTEKTISRIPEHIDRASAVDLNSLDSLAEMLRIEAGMLRENIVFVHVTGHDRVEAYTTFDGKYIREELYNVKADTPSFSFGWTEYDEAMIALRSRFEQDEEIEYILELLSRITDENSAATSDNGLSQTVEVKKGIALKSLERVRSHVTLRPYRTFLEVEQPASTFLLRLREGGEIGLFEADGGMWKLTARRTIAEYLRQKLGSLVECDKVVVTI